MKTKLSILILAFTSMIGLAHEGVERGPNGGRILDFSKNETMHGEVTIQGDKFHIALLDKDMKPVALAKQSLAATTGDRDNPQKLDVATDAKGFILPLVKEGEWLILRFKDSLDGKAITARFEYNTKECEGCKAPEWLCKCEPEKK